MLSLTLCLHFFLCPLRFWKDPVFTHLRLISPCILNSSVDVYMAEFCILSTDHNWLVSRGGLIILHHQRSLWGSVWLAEWGRNFDNVLWRVIFDQFIVKV
jgi:hypothetical protein